MNKGVEIIERYGPSPLPPGKFEFIAINCLEKQPEQVCVESMLANPRHVIITGRNEIVNLPINPKIIGKNIFFEPWHIGPASVIVFGF